MGDHDFEWDDGSKFNYDNRYTNEANHSGVCIYINDYHWFDISCSNNLHYVCKKEAT